ncbi:MAG: phosphatidate cytidylyltransferase [bacterium]|nr:MAG: phosphatidate cytidylyltransferase [bacterium]
MKRVISALVLGSATLYLVLGAPFTLGAVAVAVVIFIAAREMNALLEAAGANVGRRSVMAASVVVLAGSFLGGGRGLSLGLAGGTVIVFAGALGADSVKGLTRQVTAGLTTLLIPVWCLAHMILYLATRDGRFSLLFLLLCVWACDSAAYYAGRAYGHRKLAPLISPNKTVVGSVAGMAGGVVTGLVLRALSLVTWPVGFVLLSGLFISVLAQLGDLAESMVKRDASVKDSGTLIPGHGGILDRTDALLFTVPVFHYVLTWLSGTMP